MRVAALWCLTLARSGDLAGTGWRPWPPAGWLAGRVSAAVVLWCSVACQALGRLRLQNNRLSSLAGLRTCVGLTDLDVSRNHLKASSLRPLSLLSVRLPPSASLRYLARMRGSPPLIAIGLAWA